MECVERLMEILRHFRSDKTKRAKTTVPALFPKVVIRRTANAVRPIGYGLLGLDSGIRRGSQIDRLK